MSTDQQIEQQIQAAQLTAPRVKPEDLTANIVDTEFVTHVSKGGQVLRWAILTTASGYAVVGKPSVSVSPANDNEQIGRDVAYENSRNELWPLMGYALKEKLHSDKNGPVLRLDRNLSPVDVEEFKRAFDDAAKTGKIPDLVIGASIDANAA